MVVDRRSADVDVSLEASLVVHASSCALVAAVEVAPVRRSPIFGPRGLPARPSLSPAPTSPVRAVLLASVAASAVVVVSTPALTVDSVLRPAAAVLVLPSVDTALVLPVAYPDVAAEAVGVVVVKMESTPALTGDSVLIPGLAILLVVSGDTLIVPPVT